MSLRYALGKFEFHQNRMGDDVIVTSFNFFSFREYLFQILHGIYTFDTI